MSANAVLMNLAEAIILQSVEDLWDEGYKSDSLRFFKGEGFGICAAMAGMKRYDRLKLLQMVRISARNRAGLG